MKNTISEVIMRKKSWRKRGNNQSFESFFDRSINICKKQSWLCSVGKGELMVNIHTT
jgi:hypothetical protein